MFPLLCTDSDLLREDSNNSDAIYVKALSLYYQVRCKCVVALSFFIYFKDQTDKANQFLMSVLRRDPDHKKACQLRKVGWRSQGHVPPLSLSLSPSPLSSPTSPALLHFYFSLLSSQRSKELLKKKEEGNVAFKSGSYQVAYDIYSDALQIDPYNKATNAKLYCNRGLAAQKLGKLKESIDDCTQAIELDENYVKAYQRRAIA